MNRAYREPADGIRRKLNNLWKYQLLSGEEQDFPCGILVESYKLLFLYLRVPISSANEIHGSGLDRACGSLRPEFIVTLKMKSSKENYTFAGTHLKAMGDPASMQTRWGQYRKLENLVQEIGNRRLILLGDFNTTGYNIRNEDYTRFNNFLDEAGMWTASENIECSSYWTGADQDPNMASSILDHIVMSNALASQVEATKVGAHCQKVKCESVMESALGLSYAKVSDHCPLQVSFK